MKPVRVHLFVVFTCFLVLRTAGGAPSTVDQTLPDDPDGTIIAYDSGDGLADPVALLQKRLGEGCAGLSFEPRHGYLKSLLAALSVPISSQTLVFSKTSSQRDYTSPATPRAIYFNDAVSVAWVPQGPEIDLMSIDPKRGTIFYTLEQKAGRAQFSRRSDCLQCHLGPKTQNVPGWLVRSLYTASNGVPLAAVEGFASGHHAPINKRWGGWFVTGAFIGGGQAVLTPNSSTSFPGAFVSSVHLGNLCASDPKFAQRLDQDLSPCAQRFDAYLSSDSDLVVLLVLEHQVRMENLITRANYETRFSLAEGLTNSASRQRIVQAGEALLEYMLFRNEAPLPGRTSGSAGFEREFGTLGPRTVDGRSLRDFDLHRRLFRYPCSYLIYSPAFDALPGPMLDYVYTRLEQILTGGDQSETYAHFAPSDRREVLEILRETKPEFANHLQALVLR